MKQILFLLSFIFISLLSNAQTELWGMTQLGGRYNIGTIFKTDGSGNNLTTTYNFFKIDASAPYHTDLVEAPDGTLYGLTSAGGVYAAGTLFQFDPVTNAFNIKFEFNGTTNGGSPLGSLTLASDGKFYGMTSIGGTYSLGVLFQYDPATTIYTKKLDFDGTNNGSQPQGSLMQASDGKLYGLTKMGGVNDLGVLLQYDPVTGICVKQTDFDGTAKGSSPSGAMIQASNGLLYGLTLGGGTGGYGVLFEYNPTTNIYTKRYNFPGSANGNNPLGSLVQAANGMLYGMTNSGGTAGNGVIFQYNTTSNTYTKKIDLQTTTGRVPEGSLMSASDGMLYGMTYNGGATGDGVIFQYNPATNGYTKKIDFVNASSGRNPRSSLMQATNGNIYGMTYSGGANSGGVLFQYDVTTSNYTKKLDFNLMPEGSGPTESLIKGSDGKLYGVALAGGSQNNGVIFQYDPITLTFVKKIDFMGVSNGSAPTGNLLQASNGMFYGVTSGGGINSAGVIYQYDINTNICTKKFDFDPTVSGESPRSSLIQASDGMLYGMTYLGGAFNKGVLFQYDPSTDTYTKKFDFPTSGGNLPWGDLLQATDGMLYGMTSLGTSYNNGTLFQYNPITGVLTNKFIFDGTVSGGRPTGSLIQASNGKLYGLASGGGPGTKGVLFEYDLSTSSYVKKINFSGLNGGYPYGSPMQASNGNIYALTSYGGPNDLGTLHEYNPVSNTSTKKFDFDGTINGSFPDFTNLIEITATTTVITMSVNAISCAGAMINVPYVIGGSFGAGNIFTAQLSDATGSFAIPTSIGTLSSMSSGTISATIPGTITAGNSYRIRVVSSNPAITGSDNGINLTIGQTPTITVNSGIICSGQSFTIIPSGANTYTYSGGNSVVSPLSDASYSVTGTDSNGCESLAAAVSNVTVNALPAINASASNTLLCVGESATLTVSGPATYTWSTLENTSIIVVSPTVNTVYSVSTTDANNCSNMALVTLSVSVCTDVKSGTFNDFEMSIFPNPTKGILTLTFTAIPNNIRIELYNSIGALALSEAISNKNNMINVSELSSGMYFMKVLEGNKVVSVKKVVRE